MPPNQKLVYENEDVERVSTFKKKGYRTVPIFFVNGARVENKLAVQARSNQTLLSFLRDTLRLTGSKLGCAEGGCGACTVMISKKDTYTGEVTHFSVNACLMPALAADGCHVTTVEGVGTVKNNNLHPVQQAMVDLHGSQCGFCTPGIIVSIYTLLSNEPRVEHLEEHLDGNLCRCTGYRPIWDAARALCDDGEELVKGPCGIPCRECPERDTCDKDCNLEDKKAAAAAEASPVEYSEQVCCSSSKDKMSQYKDTLLANKEKWLNQPDEMFPAELLDEKSAVSSELSKPLMIVDKNEYSAGGTWFKPTTFPEMLQLLEEFGGTGTGNCKIVVGNTEVGIEMRFKHAFYPRLICPSQSIEELYAFVATDTKLEIGSCCPLSTIQHECKVAGTEQPRLTRTVMPIHDMLRWFASTQIRNVACLGGNLVTASPISDMNPMLASMGAKLILTSMAGGTVSQRSVAVSDFFLKYRTVDLKPTEVVECVEVPVLNEVFEYLQPFKQARRREDDISIVTSGMRMRLEIADGKFIIEDVALAFGGMSTTTFLATETMKCLSGAEFCAATFEAATEVILKEMTLPETVPGGQAAFRMTLVASFLYKFYLHVVENLAVDVKAIKENPEKFPEFSAADLPAIPQVDVKEASGTWNFLSAKKPNYSGVQVYPAPKVASGLEDEIHPNGKDVMEAKAAEVGKPATHMSGPLHCTGEAIYADDIPAPPGTLQAALLLSSECGGTVESIDTAPALALPGVVGVFTSEDIDKLGGRNEFGAIVQDELVFLPVGERVRTVGQVLGIVVGETLEAAELGARTVKVVYGKQEGKIIVTIDDAIEENSYFEFSRHGMERGDPSIVAGLAAAAAVSGGRAPKVGDLVTVSGSFRSGPQEHWYLECNSSLVIPSESDTNLMVYASTQATAKTQKVCASATGTPASKVVCIVKRMGGGFGGKETRSVFASAAASVAAKMTSRPVRLTLSRETDMKITGTRHAFLSKYLASAQITEDGAKLVAMDVKLYANGGWAFDLSGPVNDRALFHVDGCYYFPNFRSEGVVCKTVQPNHTAYRGFGGPQGIVVAEHVMDHLSVATGIPADKLRRINLYKNGDHTPFGMIIGDPHGKWNIPTMWDRLYESLNVPHRRAHIAEFNAKNKWVKRGLSLVPTKFGIAFTAKYMNQGGALVHIYTDGTVLVSHGGTEMGQGLHTKVCQVAAQAFGIPLNDVYVNHSASDKVANAIPTAASMSTDMYGMATLDACRQILARLAPIREENPDASFKDIVNKAHFARIDLSAHGFFKLEDSRCGFEWGKEKPDDFPADAPVNSWMGHPFNYFTQGVACAEVEVDLLTGNHKTLSADVIVDVGSSINPAIDIGQIEGAFIQGMGWSTIEEVIYACDDHTWIRPRGAVFTTGPGTYKIPAFNDVPEEFNVSLMENVDNPFAVHSSKAIGEPPFFLGASVFYAIKDAVTAARKQNLGEDEYFEFRLPSTSERIRMYSADPIAGKAASHMLGKETAADTFQPQGTY